MGLLASMVEGSVGIVGSFIGAMTPTQLETFLSVVRRWVARIGLAVWPDVPPSDRRRGLRRGGAASVKRPPMR